jgi:hypothetical protein
MVRIPPQWLLVRSAVEKMDLVLWRYRVPAWNGPDHRRAISDLFRELPTVGESIVCESSVLLCAECFFASSLAGSSSGGQSQESALASGLDTEPITSRTPIQFRGGSVLPFREFLPSCYALDAVSRLCRSQPERA